MSGEKDLQKLLVAMSPMLDPARYVFATAENGQKFADLRALMRFSEAEGETYILEESVALRSQLARSGPYARITLSVHSALDAVGFLAAACSALAREGISTNAVAAFHHDHIFVPYERADEAMRVLKALSTAAVSDDLLS